MIDWNETAARVAAITSGGDRIWRELDELASAAPVFQNKNFPISPLPMVLGHEAAAECAARCESYVHLLNKITSLFLTQESVRRWYGLDETDEALVMADQRLAGAVVVCRLDGYLERGTERLLLLENNADAPAGSMFTARINTMVATLLDRVGIGVAGLSALTYLDEALLLKTLSAVATSGGITLRNLAILQVAGAVTRESAEMAATFTTEGVFAYVADPRELRISGDRAYFGDRPADVCWNKVNTAPWRELLMVHPDLAGLWIRAVSETSLVHVNPFAARYVAENKLSLAFPWDPAHSHLFTPQERELVADLLPWGQKIIEGVAARKGDRTLVDDLRMRPEHYVIKEPYDIRGDGVSIGYALSSETWESAVESALKHGHLAQEYVAPTAYPILSRSGRTAIPLSASLDAFVLDGQVRGFGSKASTNAKVNVYQGGQKLAVHVLPDGA